MDAIQFTTVIGADGLIHPPEGITLPAGQVEVVVRAEPEEGREVGSPHPHQWLLDLAREAEASGVQLPDDMAENHDHYAHGAPKR